MAPPALPRGRGAEPQRFDEALRYDEKGSRGSTRSAEIEAARGLTDALPELAIEGESSPREGLKALAGEPGAALSPGRVRMFGEREKTPEVSTEPGAFEKLGSWLAEGISELVLPRETRMAINSALSVLMVGVWLPGGKAGQADGPVLTNFKQKADEILENVPDERRADAEQELQAAFDDKRLEGAEDKKIGSILGPALKQIERKYVPDSVLQQAKIAKDQKKAQEDEQKLAARETAAIGNLKAEGVWTPEIETEVNEFRDFNGSAKRIRDAILNADSEAKKGDLVMSYNVLRGLLFEISRNKQFADGNGTKPAEATPSSGPQVAYHGLKLVDGKWRLTERISAIQHDNIVLQGSQIVHEHKNYPRKNYGVADDGSWDLQALNQAMKLNQALLDPDSGLKAASIEVGGNVDSYFLNELAARAPEVEVLYCFKLPSGAEVVFRIKEGGEGRPSLKRWPDLKTLPAEEQVVVDGLRKLIQNGKLLKEGVLRNDFLKMSDIPLVLHPDHLEALDDAAKPDGSIDPLKINNLETYKIWEGLLNRKRLNYFEEKSYTMPIRRSADHLKNPVTDEAVDRYIAEAEAAVEKAPAHRQTMYTVTDPAMKAKVRDEFKRRLTAIQQFESARMNSDDEKADSEAREANGYTGPAEGYLLDVQHIYEDVVNGVKKSAEEPSASGAKPGKGGKGAREKKELQLGQTRELPARAYDETAFLTGDEIMKRLLDPNSPYKRDRDMIRIVFPDVITPDVGEQVVNALERDITSPSDRKKVLEGMFLGPNKDRLKKLRAEIDSLKDPATRTSLSPDDILNLERMRTKFQQSKDEIAEAEGNVKNIKAERDEKIQKVQGKDRAPIALEYEERIRSAERDLFKTYEKVLGKDLYGKYFSYIESEWKSDVVKFIYTIDSKGVLRMVQEDLKPGGERPAHSQLAGGLNVYAAGQVLISGKPVIGSDGQPRIRVNVIDDGSGHYRPGTFDMLPYAQAVFEENGFDVSRVEHKHAPLPFVPLGDNFDEPVQPWPGE